MIKSSPEEGYPRQNRGYPSGSPVTGAYMSGHSQGQPNDISSLLGRLPGMVYRSSFEPFRTLRFASPGCYPLTGYQPSELIGAAKLSYGDLIKPDDRRSSWQKIMSAASAGRPYSLEYRITHRNGHEIWVRDTGQAVYSTDGTLEALEGFALDITREKECEHLLQTIDKRFGALRNIDAAIITSFDPRVTFDVILDQITTNLNADAAAILVFDPHSQLLRFAAGRGFLTGTLKHTSLRVGEGYAGQAALERKIIHIPDLTQDLGELKRSPKFSQERFVVYFGVPLIARGQINGVLEVMHRQPFQPDREWMEFLQILAGQVAIAIDNTSLMQELQRTNDELSMAYDATLESWSMALEMRDHGTQGRHKVLAELTVKIAQQLRVNDNELIHIRRGALLHDVGKIAIPDSILKKPGPLTEKEWETIRQHPVYAYQLLSPIPTLKYAVDIPYCHHERWNGSGYPRGLKETQIPLSARIFAVVDVWDALQSEKPYRRAWSTQETLEYIEAHSGKLFDPTVVETFLQMPM